MQSGMQRSGHGTRLRFCVFALARESVVTSAIDGPGDEDGWKSLAISTVARTCQRQAVAGAVGCRATGVVVGGAAGERRAAVSLVGAFSQCGTLARFPLDARFRTAPGTRMALASEKIRARSRS